MIMDAGRNEHKNKQSDYIRCSWFGNKQIAPNNDECQKIKTGVRVVCSMIVIPYWLFEY